MKKISKNKIKTWFVTGASSGVGYKLCEKLLRKGYNVIAVSRRIPSFNNENALCLSVDVTDPESIKSAIKKGISRFGKIDVLSNNAGISATVVCEEETLEHIKQVMETNYFGTFNTINLLLPHFRQNANGTIINNTSMHGLSFRYGGTAYCSSKYAMEGLTSVLWHETQKFCRVMAFELGVFSETSIGKDCIKPTTIKEYMDIKPYYRYYNSFINNLDCAVDSIINEAEKEKMQRRLILGKDAKLKVKKEISSLKNDLKSSRNCSFFDKKFPLKVLRKIIRIVFKKEIMNNL